VQEMAWKISDKFSTTLSDMNYMKLYVLLYKENGCYPVYIRHNNMTCFYSDSHCTITDWWWIVQKTLTDNIRNTKNLPLRKKGQSFSLILSTIR